MPEYMRPSSVEVNAMADRIIEHIGSEFSVDAASLKTVIAGEMEILLDGMYEIPPASATIRDGMVAETFLDETQSTEATTWLYEHIFMKEGWQG